MSTNQNFKIFYLSFFLLFAFTSCDEEETIINNSKSKKDKLDICHYDTDNDTWHVINVSSNAWTAHEKHGDVMLIDADGDGWVEAENECVPGGDCDDTNPEINPGVVEILFNGVDDDCNPNTLDDKLAGFKFEKFINPKRGAFLTNNYSITVEGEACDEINTITDIHINGMPAVLTENEDCTSFSAEVNSTWGLNTIEGIAKNDIGEEVKVVQSYLQSSEFSSAPELSVQKSNIISNQINNALLTRLGQELLDDGDRTDIDDIATVLYLVLNKKLDELYPNYPNTLFGNINTTTHGCGISILYHEHTNREGVQVSKIPDFQIGDVEISFTTKENRMEMEIEMGRTKLGIEVQAYEDLGCIHPNEIGRTVFGSVGFNKIRIKQSFFLEQNGNDLELGVSSPNIEFVNPNITMGTTNRPVINAILSKVSTNILQSFLGRTENYINDLIYFDIRKTLEDILLKNTVGSIMLGSTEVNRETRVDQIAIGEGFIDLGIGAKVFPSIYKKDDNQLAHGSIIGSSSIPSFDGMNGSFGIGLKHDFTNQFFWAVWAGGELDFDNTDDLTSELANAGLDATITSIETNLPPILMPGNINSELKIGIGEILVNTLVSPSSLGLPDIGNDIPLTVAVSLFFNTNFDLNSATQNLTFTLKNDPEILVQITNVSRTLEIKMLEDQFAAVISNIMEDRMKDIVQSIPIPALLLPSLEGAIPAGTKWVLDNGTIDTSSGYFKLIGTVGVESN